MRKINKKLGFTLTEILIVIAIIGVILTISVPSIIAIRKRINERLLESKKEEILVVAELYGKDKGFTTDTTIYVYTLLESKYLEADISQNDSNCSGEHTSRGCIINPVDDSSMNNERILIKKNGNAIIAIWNGNVGMVASEQLVKAVKDKLSCNVITEKKPCLYPSNSQDNYFYYSGVMWRIIGVYKIDGKEVVKMITDDNVVWEVDA